MKILVLNLNTSPDITALVERVARTVASPGTSLHCFTASFGVRYIATRAAIAVAAYAGLDLVAEHVGRDNPQGYDAIVIACFGEPGIAAIREISPIPVVGLAEASMLTALAGGGNFAMITGGARWAPLLREYATACGFASRLAAVVTLPQSGADIARDPAGFEAVLVERCREAVADTDASSVILGGAGLAGIATRIASRVPVPVLDSVACGIHQAEALARLKPPKAQAGSYAAPSAMASQGLSPALARLLGG